jgi:hypothetical protein
MSLTVPALIKTLREALRKIPGSLSFRSSNLLQWEKAIRSFGAAFRTCLVVPRYSIIALRTPPALILALCPILDSHFFEMTQIRQNLGMVLQLPIIIVEIRYAGAREFRTIGTKSDFFTFRTGPDGAFGAEGYQPALAETSVAQEVLPLNFGLPCAQLLHEFPCFLITFALRVQVDRTSAAIEPAGRNQALPIFPGLRRTNVLHIQTDEPSGNRCSGNSLDKSSSRGFHAPLLPAEAEQLFCRYQDCYPTMLFPAVVGM